MDLEEQLKTKFICSKCKSSGGRYKANCRNGFGSVKIV